MAQSSSRADPTQQKAVEQLLKFRHHVMVNCGPGTGKTFVMEIICKRCAAINAAFLATGSSDRVVGNLVSRGGMGGATLQRISAELGRMNNALPMSSVARENADLVKFLLAVKCRKLAVLAVDECGLINSATFDGLIAKLVGINPLAFRDRRVLLYMTGDFANQLPPIEGNAFIFSTTFDLIRDNTYFPRFTKQHRFAQGTTERDVAELLSAEDSELEAYLKAQQRAYARLSPARLARLATFVTSRADCEKHIRHALCVCFDEEPIPSHTIMPAAGHTDSTASRTTAATYWLPKDMQTMVEITTMGGPLKGASEDGDDISVPNRHVCELVELYDVPEEAGADCLAGKAAAAILVDGEVVTVPLIHKLDGVNCVTLRMVGVRDGDDIVVEGHLAYNEQGYEYPGTLAVGTLGSTEPRHLSRETLLVIATRTPLGPQHAIFSPQIRLQRTNPTKYAAYRKQLALFTPHHSGSGLTMAAGTAAPKPKREGAALQPLSLSKRARQPGNPGAFLGSLY